jgi:hypothetical protein
MAYTIHPYSTGKGNTTKSVNDSISSIMSWMIQIAGRVCGDHASDVYYALCNYDNAVRENYEYDKLITFYESGVIERKIENGTVDRKSDGIQYWRLTWNPQKKEGVFTRVLLKEERYK